MLSSHISMQTGVDDYTLSCTSQYENIKYIKTELWVESTEELHDLITDELQYPRTYWEFTIYPRNI